MRRRRFLRPMATKLYAPAVPSERRAAWSERDPVRGEPDPERYDRHVEEFAAKVECDTFRHGKAFGAPFGEPAFAYYAEFECADMDAFKTAVADGGIRRERQGRDGDGHPVHRHLRRDR